MKQGILLTACFLVISGRWFSDAACLPEAQILLKLLVLTRIPELFRELVLLGGSVRKFVSDRLMNSMGIHAIFPKRRKLTSMKNHEHTRLLRDSGILISMNRKGRPVDNIAIGRFFGTLKYDDVCINDYRSVREPRNGIDRYMHFCNFNRFHSLPGCKKPMGVCLGGMKKVVW